MSYAHSELKRSNMEIVFLIFFIPAVFIGYAILKYPTWFVEDVSKTYLFGKHPGFWYNFIYTSIVCWIAGKVVLQNKSPYKKGSRPLSSYQKNKFISIFFVQLILFFAIPYLIPGFRQQGGFFNDPIYPINKDAYIYVSRGFTSWGGFFYIFVLVPLSVYFFGKRYCAWFCACGNLAETIGVTKWGSQWVKYKTPTGSKAKKLESLQTIFLIGGIFYGLVLFFDLFKLFTSETLLEVGIFYQEFVVDFIFGAIIGIAAYPFYGTRIWCRYGCPLAKGMELVGRKGYSKFAVKANDKCKGIDLCSQVCPMGINVASYAHKNKKPIEGSFGLKQTPCIGCGGCVDICPMDALSFAPLTK